MCFSVVVCGRCLGFYGTDFCRDLDPGGTLIWTFEAFGAENGRFGAIGGIGGSGSARLGGSAGCGRGRGGGRRGSWMRACIGGWVGSGKNCWGVGG